MNGIIVQTQHNQIACACCIVLYHLCCITCWVHLLLRFHQARTPGLLREARAQLQAHATALRGAGASAPLLLDVERRIEQAEEALRAVAEEQGDRAWCACAGLEATLQAAGHVTYVAHSIQTHSIQTRSRSSHTQHYSALPNIQAYCAQSCGAYAKQALASLCTKILENPYARVV